MLVLDPIKRYTIEQIKRHRWMMAEAMEPINTNTIITNSIGTSECEPNEQILRLMQGLGIDAQKTRDSLRVKKLTN